ncbi:biogenesis of lysosome-related organelles complex 1 subunit 5 [Athalia rosae]|uniref:biogenesis of lysosome-related organelles complex 1 subunit 5 n=1 Tax=Athalia rosae TaxID=37344 RepID=UPI0020340359|nr:biogenesis of lysosome-related organelles complex 1 subunit 5 [Athalia rosae]
MASIVKDTGEIWSRLFNHRPFVQGEISYFLREFEERREDREVERLFKILEYSTELGQSQFDRTEQLGDCHLPSLKANLDVALSMCQRVLEQEEKTENDKKLQVNRETRKSQWQKFINDMSSKCEKVDKTFEEKEEELRGFYQDLEEKLHISP